MKKRKVLHFIKENEGCSRADISRGLSISKPTSTKIVNELLDDNLIKEQESEKYNVKGGRKPLSLFFNKNAKFIVSIDIGGTNIDLALTNLEGEIIDLTSYPTQAHLSAYFNDTLIEQVNHLLKENNLEETDIVGIGLGIPGIVDIATGEVIDAPSLGWKNYELMKDLKQMTSIPLFIDNDVNLAALGEHWKGEGQNIENLVVITLGTGVGCGLILNNQLYRGSTLSSGEIGYMITDKNAIKHSYDKVFPGYGFLENQIGGAAIAKKNKGKSAKDLFELAKQKDDDAKTIINNYLMHLITSFINIITIMNPEKIVIGGKISHSIQHFLPYIRNSIKQQIPIHPDLVVTDLENASLIGGVNLVLKESKTIL